jgi:hypothetical protein
MQMNHASGKKKFLLVLSIFLIAAGLSYHSTAFETIRHRARGVYYAVNNGKEQFRYTGAVTDTPKGKPALTLSIRSLMKENQIILFVGRVTITGKITPQTTNAPLPTKLRFVVNHKNAGGQVSNSTNLDVNVQSNGAILSQNLPFSSFDLIDPKETLDLSMIPIDRNLPAGTVILNIVHTIGANASNMIPDDAIETAASINKLTFVFNNYLSGHAKNEVIGPLSLKTPKAPAFFSKGTLRVAGKITPFDAPGLGLPNRFMMILKHKLQAGGKLIKTENFIVNLKADGVIAPQVFQVDSQTLEEKPDVLEISMKYLDKAIPDRVVNVNFTFTSQE